MIKSMTGYGQASNDNNGVSIHVEVKTLNAKFLDSNLRLPKEIQEKEIEIRNLISEKLVRGKVSLVIDINREANTDVMMTFNKVLFENYYNELRTLAETVDAPASDILKVVLSYPEVTKSKQTALSEEVWKAVKSCIKDALADCDDFRTQEGNALTSKLKSYIDLIKSNFDQIVLLDPDRVKKIKNRINTNLEEIVGIDKIDQNRFEQELIYYIEKIDITEEKVRLTNHLSYFLETLKEKDAPGKKLGFITQEIGREINTIGSKANDAEIQKHVVVMKDNLEKIKEQTLNIL